MRCYSMPVRWQWMRCYLLPATVSGVGCRGVVILPAVRRGVVYLRGRCRWRPCHATPYLLRRPAMPVHPALLRDLCGVSGRLAVYRVGYEGESLPAATLAGFTVATVAGRRGGHPLPCGATPWPATPSGMAGHAALLHPATVAGCL